MTIIITIFIQSRSSKHWIWWKLIYNRTGQSIWMQSKSISYPYKPTYREIFDSAYIHTECVLIYVLGKLNSIGTGGSRRMAADRWEPKALWSDFALVDVNANYFTITNPRRAGLRSGVQEGATSLLTCVTVEWMGLRPEIKQNLSIVHPQSHTLAAPARHLRGPNVHTPRIATDKVLVLMWRTKEKISIVQKFIRAWMW